MNSLFFGLCHMKEVKRGPEPDFLVATTVCLL